MTLDLIPRAEVARQLGMSERELTRFVQKIPGMCHVKLSRRVLFEPHYIPMILDALDAEASTPAEDEIVAQAQPISPKASGIYFLIQGGRIIYIGQAMNVVARVGMHLETKMFDAWHWIPCEPEELAATERAYLNAFLPPLNMDGETQRRRKAQAIQAAA